MAIRITVEAVTAAEVKQLVHDLAGTMAGMAPEQIPPQTHVSTVPASQQPAYPQPVPAAQQPVQTAYPQAAPVQTYTATQPPLSNVTPFPTQPDPAGVVPTAAPQPPTAVPTVPQTYTLDQLAVAATQLMDAGRQPDIMNLLAQFQVPALTALPKEQYGAFATALRGLGAKI